MAHMRCMLDKQGYMHARACTLLRAQTPTHTHTHTTHARTRAHRTKYLILIAFPWQQWFRGRASVLRYTYIACIVDTREKVRRNDNSTDPSVLKMNAR